MLLLELWFFLYVISFLPSYQGCRTSNICCICLIAFKHKPSHGWGNSYIQVALTSASTIRRLCSKSSFNGRSIFLVLIFSKKLCLLTTQTKKSYESSCSLKPSSQGSTATGFGNQQLAKGVKHHEFIDPPFSPHTEPHKQSQRNQEVECCERPDRMRQKSLFGALQEENWIILQLL